LTFLKTDPPLAYDSTGSGTLFALVSLETLLFDRDRAVTSLNGVDREKSINRRPFW